MQCPTCGNLLTENSSACNECGLDLQGAGAVFGGESAERAPQTGSNSEFVPEVMEKSDSESRRGLFSGIVEATGDDHPESGFSFDFATTVTHDSQAPLLRPATQHNLLDEDLDTSEPPVATLDLVRAGLMTGDTFTLKPPIVIGRFDPETGPVDIDLGQFPEAVYVSRHHAEITLERGRWRLRDLDSRNGTFVRGLTGFQRVTDGIYLKSGDEIALGNARFLFRI